MKHEIIKTENYLLVVDESEIREDDKSLLKVEDFEPMILTHYEPVKKGYEGKKIIAHLPLNNSPFLEGVDLLPPLEQEDDVEKLANIQWGNVHRTGVLGYIEGYNKAKEKYKYTEEDMRNALFNALNQDASKCCVTHTRDSVVRKIIQSLSQPKMPIGFDCEAVCDQCLGDDSVDSCYCNYGIYKIVPKTTTNSQGQKVLVGNYVF